AIKKNPIDAAYHCNLGNALHELGRLDEAVASYHKTLALVPGDSTAHSTLGLAYQRQLLLNYADDPKAVKISFEQTVQRAVALDREDAESHTVLGMAIFRMGNADEALSVLRTAIDLNPSYAFAHSTLGLVLGTSSRPEEAMVYHETAIRLSPRDPQLAIFLSRYANSCINAEKYEQAVELSKRATYPTHLLFVASARPFAQSVFRCRASCERGVSGNLIRAKALLPVVMAFKFGRHWLNAHGFTMP
ncbi:MAG TPA: tetratricopeptide repeat protein, partial [Oceanospirillaceae bacterium]|nr:tetratricopeptide repeat protein [Oceanospirillaceae bacterium]